VAELTASGKVSGPFVLLKLTASDRMTVEGPKAGAGWLKPQEAEYLGKAFPPRPPVSASIRFDPFGRNLGRKPKPWCHKSIFSAF